MAADMAAVTAGMAVESRLKGGYSALLLRVEL